jgi:hypothetical protein
MVPTVSYSRRQTHLVAQSQLCELSRVNNTRIKSKEASRAGSSRVWIPELGSLKIWADFTWTTGTEPRDSGESRYA